MSIVVVLLCKSKIVARNRFLFLKQKLKFKFA